MIFQSPALTYDDEAVLELILAQRAELRHQVNQSPNRWTGVLRRNSFARAVQGSNAIEGFNTTVEEATEIIDDDRPDGVEDGTWRALVGYRNAMTYILQVHDDPHLDVNAQFIKSLHFMMIMHDLPNMPGQWRPGAVTVTHSPSGEIVYEAPEKELVPDLINAMLAQIDDPDAGSTTVRAAMVHLNLTMIHPFKDGNGRMARALQSLVLARDGILSPIFCSIEEWLGRNMLAYYRVLADVGEGKWNPGNDALPWVRFCFRAHYQQAETLIRRYQEIGRVWEEISRLVRQHDLRERMELALVEAAFGLRVRNQRYRDENTISESAATRDLRELCEAKLLEPVGQKRGRYYIGTEALRSVRTRIRDTRPVSDPYEFVERQSQPSLPGVDHHSE